MLATLDKVETPQQQRKRERTAKRAQADWTRAHKAATSYGAALRKYAEQIATIIEHYATPEGVVAPERQAALNEALRRYTTAIMPWARRTAARMVAEVNRRNLTTWQQYTATMSAELRAELATAPIGAAVEDLMTTQAALITSLPMDAAMRVQEASLEAITVGSRYPEQTDEIEDALARAHPDATASWLKQRATLIARTETARAQSVLTQARAEHVGSTHYIWKSGGDWKVRPSHKKLDGSVQAWAEEPLSDPPDHYAHPGCIWNCRCVAIPILGDT